MSSPLQKCLKRRTAVNTLRDIDKGWAWVILGMAFVSSAIIYGHIVNAGIYYTTFLDTFGESRSYTAWITTAQGTALHITGSLSSYLLARWGARITMMSGALIASLSLLVTYLADSVLFLIVTFAVNGVGISLLMSSCLAPISSYFNKYFYLAIGLTNSGAGLGIMLMGIELEWVIAQFGWKGSMFIQSGVVLQLAICAALIFPFGTAPVQTSPMNYRTMTVDGVARRVDNARRTKMPSPVHFLRDVRYQLILMIFFTFYLALNIFVLIMKETFISKGFEMPYATVVSCFGISNIAGRLSSGIVAKYFLVSPLQFFLVSTLTAVISLSLIFVHLQWLYALCFVILGFAIGQQSTLLSLTVAYIFGRKLMPVLFSFALIMGVPSFVGGSPIAGYIFDVTGSYDGAHFFCALSFLLCGLLNLFCYLVHRRKVSTQKDEAEIFKTKLLAPIKGLRDDTISK